MSLAEVLDVFPILLRRDAFRAVFMDGAFNWHWKNVRCIFVLQIFKTKRRKNMVSEEQKKNIRIT